MLRCLEEEQRQGSKFVASTPPSNSVETATKRLNKGYGSLIASGVSARPTLALFSSTRTDTPLSNVSAPSSTLPESPTQTIPATEPPNPSEPRSSPSTDALNAATVELEHQKFLEEPVVPATELNGLSPVDYWLVRTSHLGFLWDPKLLLHLGEVV